MTEIKKWGITRHDFENNWIGNTIGSFKVQRSVAAANGLLTAPSTPEEEKELSDKLDKLFDALGTNMINALKSSPNGKILRQIHFEDLPEKTKEIIRNGIYEAIQDNLYNKGIWERRVGSELQNNAFSVSTETVSWLLASDVFNMYAKNLFMNAGLHHYEVVDSKDYEAYTITSAGHHRIITKFDPDETPDLQ